MPDAMTDRRVAPRYPLILVAEITDLLSTMKFTARTADISRTGCYIDMLQPLPRGTQVHVRLISAVRAVNFMVLSRSVISATSISG